MTKSNKERAKEYLNDKRWKAVKEYSDQGRFEKANTLANQIIDSYPAHIRSMAKY